jgi:hypothetical protein
MLQGHGIGSTAIATLLLVFWNSSPVNAEGTGLPSTANARQIGPYQVSVNCMISNVGNNGPAGANLGELPIISFVRGQFPPTPIPPGSPMPNRKLPADEVDSAKPGGIR